MTSPVQDTVILSVAMSPTYNISGVELILMCDCVLLTKNLYVVFAFKLLTSLLVKLINASLRPAVKLSSSITTSPLRISFEYVLDPTLMSIVPLACPDTLTVAVALFGYVVSVIVTLIVGLIAETVNGTLNEVTL